MLLLRRVEMEQKLEQMVAEQRRRLEEHFPAPYQPRIPTMGRKAEIETAFAEE